MHRRHVLRLQMRSVVIRNGHPPADLHVEPRDVWCARTFFSGVINPLRVVR
jgi:hypothetical protein